MPESFNIVTSSLDFFCVICLLIDSLFKFLAFHKMDTLKPFDWYVLSPRNADKMGYVSFQPFQ